jgi:predicted MFS family arabinose efflux permease
MRPARQPTPPRTRNELRRARGATFAIFWLCGVIASLWSASLPSINNRLHLGETRLGFALLLVGAGAIAVMPTVGRMCDRYGSRRVLRLIAPLCPLPLLGPALAGSYPVLLASAFVLGAGGGGLDVAMNAHAIVVEQRYGRSIMSAFHGLWSVGGVTGSAVIAAGLRAGAPDPALVIGGAIGVAALLAVPGPMLVAGGGTRPSGDAAAGDGAAARRAGSPLRNPTVVLLGVVCLAGFMAEGAAYSWAPLHAIKELHVTPPVAALAYTIFAAALTTGRLTGDWLRRHVGMVRGMAWAGGVAAVGYLLVLLAPSLHASALACDYAGWAVAGFGLATVVPGIFTAVGSFGSGVGRALSLVATCGYAGELAGPALIGPLAAATSLRVALLVPGALTLVIAALGPVAVRRATGRPREVQTAGAGTPMGLG